MCIQSGHSGPIAPGTERASGGFRGLSPLFLLAIKEQERELGLFLLLLLYFSRQSRSRRREREEGDNFHLSRLQKRREEKKKKEGVGTEERKKISESLFFFFLLPCRCLKAIFTFFAKMLLPRSAGPIWPGHSG